MNNSRRLIFSTLAVFLLISTVVFAAAQVLDVTIIDRKNNETAYSYVAPGRTTEVTSTDVNCRSGVRNEKCTSSTTTSGVVVPPTSVSYNVTGSTLSLRLPDGRVAVVNCDSKYALKGDNVNRRSCRIPPINNIQAEFDGDKAKLKWPVSIDGKKFDSETYKIVAILNKQ